MRVAAEGMGVDKLLCTEVVIFVVIDNMPLEAFSVVLPVPVGVLPATRLDFEARPIFRRAES